MRSLPVGLHELTLVVAGSSLHREKADVILLDKLIAASKQRRHIDGCEWLKGDSGGRSGG